MQSTLGVTQSQTFNLENAISQNYLHDVQTVKVDPVHLNYCCDRCSETL